MGYQSMRGNNSQLLSRIAAGDGHGENSSYFEGWKAYDSNPFNPSSNQGGVIQMGLAENLVGCFPYHRSTQFYRKLNYLVINRLC